MSCESSSLPQLYPREEVADLLTRCHAWEERERKLSQVVMVYYVIGLSLLRRLNLAAVLRFLARGLRWLWPDPELALPTAGALVYRRKQSGVTVLRQLFRHRCQPMATQETKGAFRFGLRLMAIDSTLDEVADTPANALHFGRLTTGKSASPFPQIRCLYLAEAGTHAIVDATLAPCRGSPQRLAPSVLRSVEPGMLVLCDRNFPSIEFLAAIRKLQAHVLARVAVNHYTQAEQVRSSGSYLVTLHPHDQPPRPRSHHRISPASPRDPGVGAVPRLAQCAGSQSQPSTSTAHHLAGSSQRPCPGPDPLLS